MEIILSDEEDSNTPASGEKLRPLKLHKPRSKDKEKSRTPSTPANTADSSYVATPSSVREDEEVSSLINVSRIVNSFTRVFHPIFPFPRMNTKVEN